jgi:hypothetical protein
MKRSDLPLVRPVGARLSPEALRFVAKVAELFPGSERDVITIRKPISSSPREGEKGKSTEREGKGSNVKSQTAT